MQWLPYDPAWLVELARKQEPALSWLPTALEQCRVAHRASAAYTYFVDPSEPNKPGSAWQFQENIILEHPEHGDIVLDVLKGERVGGIEFLDEL